MPTPSGSDGHPLRCALVGLGQIGTTHLEAMHVGGAELVAVADPREAARAVAERRACARSPTPATPSPRSWTPW
jgi:predicted dehydrogenase